MMNTKLDTITKVLAKIVEVIHWIGVVCMLACLVLTLLFGADVVAVVPSDYGAVSSVYGFELVTVNTAGELNMTALRLLLIGGAILLGLMAMVFRKVFLIMKSAEQGSPFQPDNVRRVREIGILLIIGPIVSLNLSILARLILGPETAEISVGLESFLIGLVVLCLSRFFARGMELETDVDGLL